MLHGPWLARAGREPGVYGPDAAATAVTWIRRHDAPHGRDVYRLAVSANAQLIAVASKTGHIAILNMEGGIVAQFLHATPGLPVAVTGLVFLGETTLVSSGTDGELRVYDVSSGTKTGVVRADAPVYGLTAVNATRIVGITRTPEGDRLHAWDLNGGQVGYQGPVFKIASFYLTVTVAIGGRRGQLAHGDRDGQLHVYTPRERGYVHATATTDHGDFSAVAILGDSVITAGEGSCDLTTWTLEPLARQVSLSLPSPATWICLWDEASLLTIARDGRLQRVSLRGEPRVAGAGTLGDVRDVVGPSDEQVARAAIHRDRAAAASLVAEIRGLLTRRDHGAAEMRILELEERGFVSEALQLFAEMYREQRNLMGELRSLFAIVTEVPPDQVPVEVLDRAAFLFEAVHEPELAAMVLASAAGDAANDERVRRIARLAPSFLAVPGDTTRVAVAGLPDVRREPRRTVEAAVMEVQKSEALRRYFEDDIVFLQSKAEDVQGTVAMDDLQTELRDGAVMDDLMGDIVVTPVIWKRGKHLGRSEQVLQMLAPTGRGLDGIALWLTLEAQGSGTRLTTYGVFQPGSPDRSPDWNQRQSDRIVRCLADGLALEWFDKVNFQVSTCLARVLRDPTPGGLRW